MADNWKLWACGEYCRVRPDGQIEPADRGADRWRVDAPGPVALVSLRNGWCSFRAVVEGAGELALSARVKGDGLAVELHREFYHKLAKAEPGQEWHADALVPVRSGKKLALPDPDNNVPGQTAQSFWIDVWVGRDAAVGVHRGKLELSAGGQKLALELAVDVLELSYPDDDCISMDFNSYGSDFLLKQYPRTVPQRPGDRQDAAIIKRIHQYHAMIFEHHGRYHQLGFGHSGATNRYFAPGLSGDGAARHVADWRLYDAHYGPLLDGSAFAGGRRKPQPVYSIYTPINPGWPADWLGFGQPGYRVELVNVLKDFDAHFRQNGWTHTVLEYFFNHKKRYRYFEWDGDEPRFDRDDVRFRQYRAWLDEATQGSPVQWRFRCDASWMQQVHWKSLAGVVDFWVNGGFVDFFEKDVHEGPMARGDIVWTYRGAPPFSQPAGDIIQQVYRTWAMDFTGNTLWLTTGVGADPWFASDGCATGLIYPGERFGIDGPIPSARMKVMRNAVQDVNLLELAAKAGGKGPIKARLAAMIPMRLWFDTPDDMRNSPPMEWGMKTVRRPIEPDQARSTRLDPLWWQQVRNYARSSAQEVSRG